MINLAVCAP